MLANHVDRCLTYLSYRTRDSDIGALILMWPRVRLSGCFYRYHGLTLPKQKMMMMMMIIIIIIILTIIISSSIILNYHYYQYDKLLLS